MTAPNLLEKGLPANLDAERFVLGSILLDDAMYVQAAGALEADDFSLEKHRRIFRRMGELQERGEKIDRITIANELMKFNELEACDGLSYLVSLDDGLPHLPNLDSYVRIVKDKAILRRIITTSQSTDEPLPAGGGGTGRNSGRRRGNPAQAGRDAGEERPVEPAADRRRVRGRHQRVPRSQSKRVKGISTGFTKLRRDTPAGMHGGELLILAARPSMGKTALALNIAQHVALKLKQTVAVFSLEMSKESLLTRMLCATARVDSQRFRAGYLNQDERRKLQPRAA